MSNKRSLDERIEEKLNKEQEYLQKAKQYSAQAKKLEQQKKAEERKIRTHRLIEIGGAVESVLGRPFADGDIERLIHFLREQERRGGYFSKALAVLGEPESPDTPAAQTVGAGNGEA